MMSKKEVVERIKELVNQNHTAFQAEIANDGSIRELTLRSLNLSELKPEIRDEFCELFPLLNEATSITLNDSLNDGYFIFKNLTGVNRLRIYSSKTLPKEYIFSNLESLNRLELSDCDLDPNLIIEEIQNIEHLSIDHAPKSKTLNLSKLKKLKSLSVTNSNLNNVEWLKTLNNKAIIKSLILYHNNIEKISIIDEFINLKTLDLESNKIANFDSVKHLSKLTSLNLAKNPIIELPEWLIENYEEVNWEEDMYQGNGVTFYNNPLVHPPVEIVKQGRDSIVQYFKSFKSGDKVKLNEVKVLLVGEGMAGKTSLLKQIQGDDFNDKESQTHGINVVSVKGEDITQNNDESFENCQLHFWDFGGQEIMHASHQFFMSERALYVLVLDSRTDSKKYYWLKHIEKFGGNSPIILVMNKMDDNANYNVQQKELNRQFPGLKNRFFKVSCKRGDGIAELLAALPQAIQDTSLYNSDISLEWMRIKQDLVQATAEKKYIDHQRFKEICVKHGIIVKAAQQTLLQYLHDLGVVLHFEELNLNNIFVLDPHWVTIGVYKIINSGKIDQGMLSVSDLEFILNKEEINPNEYDPARDKAIRYSPDEQSYLVNIMELFELCYAIDNSRAMFIIPDLLPKELAEEPELDDPQALQFVMEYDYLPSAVISRLMLHFRNDIEQGQQWRFGMILFNKKLGCRAKIRVFEDSKRIHIWITGEQFQKQKYFAVIYHQLCEINDSFKKLEIEEKIPLPGFPDELVNYEEILGLEKMGKAEYVHGKLQKEFSVSQLLDCYSSQQQRRESAMSDKIRHSKDSDGINVHLHMENFGNSSVAQHNQQTTSQTSKQHSQLTSTQKQSIKLDIGQLQGAFKNLSEDLLEEAELEIDDQKEIKRLGNDLNKVSKAMVELQHVHSEGERQLTPSTVDRFQDFVDNVQDKSSRIGKILDGFSDGKKKVQKLAGTYNKIAPYFALPVIPNEFLDL